MTQSDPSDTVPGSQLLATVLIDRLLACGVTDMVLAPGSRSAPIAYAAWHVRDRLRIHVRIDERSAGFHALGLARGSGRPVAVAVTSGTAAGNLLPAMMEAYHSRLPLIAVTADRPMTMINTGANQTTDQIGIYDRHLRAEARLSSADADPRAWAHAITRALVHGEGRRGGTAGPVHLEMAFADPLVPSGEHPILDLVDTELIGDCGEPEPVQITCGPGTVVVAGDLDPVAGHRLAAAAAKAQIPLFAEPTSNARHSPAAISGYRLLLGTALADTVHQVIMVGRPTLSRPVQRLLARRDVELVVVDPAAEWIDPATNARRVVPAVELGVTDGAALVRWRAVDDAVLARLADEPATRDSRLAPLPLAGAVIDAAADASVVLGSSSPIRDADLVRFPEAPGTYHANRGLAGIDGTVSTAWGIACASPSVATWLFCGDLTFLHDANGLLVGRDEPAPVGLRVVVANDDGGSIFATLEHGRPERAATFERLFGTAHHADLGSLCAAHRISHRRVTDPEQLRETLATPVNGVDVVEAVVDRADRHVQSARWQALAQDAAMATVRRLPRL